MTARPGPRTSRRRSEANYGPQRGTTYLIHFARPFGHAKHYKGWTDRPVEERFADHLAGRGALLTRLVAQAGIGMTLARTWPDTTKDREDSVKRSGGKRMCPECGVTPGHGRLPSDKAPEQQPQPGHRPMWQADRDGQWDDGTPIIYDPDLTWQQAAQQAARLQLPDLTATGRNELARLDELERAWKAQEEPMSTKPELAGAERDAEIERLAQAYPEPDHLYGAPECAEADPETEHFGWAAPEPQDAGRFPLPRALEPAASPALAPLAATLPDGTPHADPFLAERGWQAQGGLYVRQPQAQAEAV